MEWLFLVFDKVRFGSCAFEQSLDDVVQLRLCGRCSVHTRNNFRQTTRRDHDATTAHKRLELSYRFQRHAFHTGKNHYSITSGAQHKVVLLNAASLQQHLVIKKIKT